MYMGLQCISDLTNSKTMVFVNGHGDIVHRERMMSRDGDSRKDNELKEIYKSQIKSATCKICLRAFRYEAELKI